MSFGIRQILRSLRHTLGAGVGLMFTVGGLMILISFLLQSILSLRPLLDQLGKNSTVIVFLKNEASLEQITKIEEALKSLSSDVKHYEFHSAEEESLSWAQAWKDPKIITLSKQLVQPVFDVDVQKGKMDYVKSVLSKVDGVQSIEDSAQIQSDISHFRSFLIYAMVAVVLFSFLILNLTLLTISEKHLRSRSRELEILFLLGTTPGQVRYPVLAEILFWTSAGCLIGMISSWMIWQSISHHVQTGLEALGWVESTMNFSWSAQALLIFIVTSIAAATICTMINKWENQWAA